MRNKQTSQTLTTQEVQQVVRKVVEEMNQHNQGVLNGLQDLNPLDIPFILERNDVYEDWLEVGIYDDNYGLTEEGDILFTQRLQELLRMFTREELETPILDYFKPENKVYEDRTLLDYLIGEISMVTDILSPVVDTNIDTLHPQT